MKKISLLFLLVLSGIIAGCSSARTASQVCRTSCDDIIKQLGKTSSTLDDALVAARSIGMADDAGRLFNQTDDQMDDLARLLKSEVAVQEYNPVQLTDEIMRSSSQFSDEITRLQTWAENYQEGFEFYGKLVCGYRDAYEESWKNAQRDPDSMEIGASILNRFSNVPANAYQLGLKWDQFQIDLNQNNIDVWDDSITLYCILSEVTP